MNLLDRHQTTPDSEPTLNIALRGRALRFVLVDELRQRETMTVAEMVTVLADYGYDVGGRASKVISDALRWELARRRVQRVGRGLYRYLGAPLSTVRRIRIFAASCRAWLVATTRTQPPTQPLEETARRQPSSQPEQHDQPSSQPDPPDPPRAPWEHLGWLWTT